MTQPVPARRWPSFRHVIFDCDATLAMVEGIEELAAGEHDERVEQLTRLAMSGAGELSDVYEQRLDLLTPSRNRVRSIRSTYRRSTVPGAREVIAALTDLGHEIHVVSGGLVEPVRDFAVHLGVAADNVHAVDLRYDRFGSAWWLTTGPDDARYAGFEPGPLTTSCGKREVIAELLRGRRGRSLLVGDGFTDLAAAPTVDLFVGFGGVRRNGRVAAAADVFISGPTLEPVLALAGGTAGREALARRQPGECLERGLAAIASGDVSFRDPATQERFRTAFALHEGGRR